MAKQEATEARPKRKLFYGWVLVGVFGLTNAIATSLGAVNLGLFINPMGHDIGMSRSMFGWAQTSRQTAGAVASPIIGRLLDRFGARIMLPFAIVSASIAVILVSFSTHAWQVLSIFALMGLMGLGGGAQLLTSVPISKWFVRKRGRAMALAGLGTTLGVAAFTPWTGFLITEVGWREAWRIIGVTAIVIVVPLSWIFIKRQPEDVGLQPDGDAAVEMTKNDAAAKRFNQEISWTFKEAVRTPTFWRLTATFSIISLGQFTVGLHRIPSFVDKGIDPKVVSYAISAEAITAAGSMMVMGFLYERFQPRIMGSIGIVIIATSVFFTMIADSIPLMFLATLTFGLGVGGNLLMQNNVWADYFGRRYIGSIRGSVMPFMLFFSGIGSPIAGYVFDATGSYNPMWRVSIGLMLFGAFLLVLTPKPIRK